MISNNNKTLFLRFTAVCSMLGALTTILLIFLPSPQAEDFEAMVKLQSNRLYLSKLWILFIHPQVNFIASLGIAFLLFKRKFVYVFIGTVFLFIWAYTEMSQQALLIDSLNQLWRPGYSNANDEAAKTMYRTLIKVAEGVSDSKYFLVIYSFGIGSILYGLAFLSENKFGKIIGISLLFIGVLSLCSFARFYLGINSIDQIVDWAYEWIYSYLQPLVRIAIGVWILAETKRQTGAIL